MTLVDTLTKALAVIAVMVRDELRESYDVSDQIDIEHRNFRGLCDEACALVLQHLKELQGYGHTFSVNSIHGEQRHTPRLKSGYWCLEHTWIEVVFSNPQFGKLYLDPTMSQFQYLYPDMPFIYLENTPPKWYLPDAENYLYSNSIFSNILKKRYTHSKVFDIIQFIEYRILGGMSDFIRILTGRSKEMIPPW